MSQLKVECLAKEQNNCMVFCIVRTTLRHCIQLYNLKAKLTRQGDLRIDKEAKNVQGWGMEGWRETKDILERYYNNDSIISSAYVRFSTCWRHLKAAIYFDLCIKLTRYIV